MTPATFTMLIAVILLLSVGQVLFKHASDTVQLSNPQSFLSAAMLAAVTVYAIATVGWVLVLARVPLSVAFPFYGLAFLIVPVLASAFLAEPLRPQTLLGGIVIACGIYICSRS